MNYSIFFDCIENFYDHECQNNWYFYTKIILYIIQAIIMIPFTCSSLFQLIKSNKSANKYRNIYVNIVYIIIFISKIGYLFSITIHTINILYINYIIITLLSILSIQYHNEIDIISSLGFLILFILTNCLPYPFIIIIGILININQNYLWMVLI